MPRKIRRRKAKNAEAIMSTVRAQRGLDRERHFKEGGTLVEWMGGPNTKTKNMRAWENKRRARGKIRC